MELLVKGLSFLFRHDLGIAALLSMRCFDALVISPGQSQCCVRLIAGAHAERPLDTVENAAKMHQLIVVAFFHVIQLGRCCGYSVGLVLNLLSFSVGSCLTGRANVLGLSHRVDRLIAQKRAGMPRADSHERPGALPSLITRVNVYFVNLSTSLLL